MPARYRCKVLVVGMLAAILSAPASAGELLTVQQTEIGLAAFDAAAPQSAPTIASESYATVSSGRPIDPATGGRARASARNKPDTPRYVKVSARRSCSLGCRGVLVLGVGF